MIIKDFYKKFHLSVNFNVLDSQKFIIATIASDLSDASIVAEFKISLLFFWQLYIIYPVLNVNEITTYCTLYWCLCSEKVN